jgi:hypothetical protein
MSAGGPEWISVTIIDVIMHTEDAAPVMARCQIGIVRMPDGETRIATRVLDRPLFILPPQAAARAAGALRRALRAEGLDGLL